MKQGEIWYADLNPTKGNEQRGRRPVVIISGNAMNDHLRIVIVCPLTSKIKNFSGCVVLEPTRNNGLKETSEVITFHVRSISEQRLVNRIGIVSEEQLAAIISGLNDVLTY